MTDWSREFMHRNWAHQDREFEEHRDAQARALHWQMRTGKSKAMVDLACYLYTQGKIDGVLILAPNNVHGNWVRREIPEHSWIGAPFRSMAWSTMDAKQASYDVAFGQLLDYKGLAWYAVNVEATVMATQLPYLKAFMKRRRFLLIVDETHEWRRPGSKRSQVVRNQVARKAVAVRNLSGTMVDNNPLHAYAQYEILAKGTLGFTDFKSFEVRYGVWEKDTIYVGGRERTIPKLVGFQRQAELRKRMVAWTSYVYRDECDDLPELVRGTGDFEMHGQAKRIYNELVRGALVSLDCGEPLDVDPEKGLITKLQSVRSGFIKDQNGELHWLVEDDENPAFQALLEEVQRTDGKLIVWCRFRAEIERICAFLRRKGHICVDYYGKTTPADRVRNEERFRSDPTVKCMVAQPKACGQGLDFSAGEHIVWFSYIHGDLIGRRQADERCTKVGGRKIAVTNLVGRGTVDEKIIADEDAKVVTTEFLTGEGLREYLRIAP